MKRISKSILAFASICLIALAVGYCWVAIYPRFIIKEPIERFENSFYSGHPENCFEVLVENSRYAEITKRHMTDISDLFSRFEKGFEVSFARRFFITNPRAGEKSSIITAEISKIAKIDGKPRDYFQVDLVFVDGSWKIKSYYFPDFINY